MQKEIENFSTFEEICVALSKLGLQCMGSACNYGLVFFLRIILLLSLEGYAPKINLRGSDVDFMLGAERKPRESQDDCEHIWSQRGLRYAALLFEA